jgi:hypothetical protein
MLLMKRVVRGRRQLNVLRKRLISVFGTTDGSALLKLDLN